MKIPLLSLSLGLALGLALGTGCHDRSPHAPTPSGSHAHAHDHHHAPPHGGAPVVLGDEAYHLEFVLDAATGQLGAYVLDGHMEKFVRLPAPALEVALQLPEIEPVPVLTLAAVANPATGETLGDTSHFAGQSDWLIGRTNFNAVLRHITIRGRTFQDVAFRYPQGNE